MKADLVIINLVVKGTPVLILAPLLMASGPGRTVWDQVYTDAQAGRGLQVYTDHCALCHASGMQGGPGSPALIGPEFRFLWADKSVGALYEIIRAKMPPGQAGTLSDQEYADVLAAILQSNGFPPGEGNELPSDSAFTSDIMITWEKP